MNRTNDRHQTAAPLIRLVVATHLENSFGEIAAMGGRSVDSPAAAFDNPAIAAIRWARYAIVSAFHDN